MRLNQRLKPFYADALETANIKYPNIVASICDELQTKTFVRELTYGCVFDLQTVTNSRVSPYDMFEEL